MKRFGFVDTPFSCMNHHGSIVYPHSFIDHRHINDAHIHWQEAGREFKLLCKNNDPMPGLLPHVRNGSICCALFKPLFIRGAGHVSLVQVVSSTCDSVEENHSRMVEMCGELPRISLSDHVNIMCSDTEVTFTDNHPMFQMLFDRFGSLKTANKRAIINMRGGVVLCRISAEVALLPYHHASHSS